jgi:hypothetical protein
MITRVPRVMLTIVGAALAAAAAAPADGPLRVPPDDLPASMAALAPFQDALAVAVSHDAALAAAAFLHPGKAKSSLVRIAGGGEPVRDVDVRGMLRSLRFDTDGGILFGIAHRPGKRDSHEAWLILIDVATLKVTRSVTLPETARDLDTWVNGGALLVACRDEVRTVLLPQVRTGPLFWVGGTNHAVASLPGGDFVLVGQDSQILLVNLADPQGRDPLPVRDRFATTAAVASLAASPDGTAALARLENGEVLEISVDPVRVDTTGNADLIAWLGRPVSAEPAPSEAGATVVESDATVTTPAPEVPPPTVTTEPPPSEDLPAPVEPGPAVPAPGSESGASESPPTVQEPSAVTAAQEVPSPGPGDPAPTPDEGATPATSADRGELEGRVTGAAASEVVAVILLGPDNITREATRVRPAPNGSWVAVDLVPGRYRVVLDGGGDRVLASDPSFRQSRVVAGIRIEVPPIEALRAIDR